MEERFWCTAHHITNTHTHTQIYTRTSENWRKLAQEVETRAQIGVNQRKLAQVQELKI